MLAIKSDATSGLKTGGLKRLATAGALGLALMTTAMPAYAQFKSDNTVQTPFGRAPLSFADIVDRVKPSVVSIFVSGGGAPKVAQNQAPGQKGPQARLREGSTEPSGGCMHSDA